MNRYQTLERRLGALIVDLIVVATPIAVLDIFVRSLDLSALLLIPWLLIATFAGAVLPHFAAGLVWADSRQDAVWGHSSSE